MKKILSAFTLAILFFLPAFTQSAESNDSPQLEDFSTIKPTKQIVINTKELKEIVNSRVIYPSPKDPPEEQAVARERNKVFQTYEKEREASDQQLRRTGEISSVMYVYRLKKTDVSKTRGFTQLCAGFNQGQGTLATINEIDSQDSLKDGQLLLLPVAQGLFIAKNPVSQLEIFLKKEYEQRITKDTVEFIIDGKEFFFLPGITFSQTDKAYFVDTSMQLPLDKKILTSPFGYRVSPISGKWKLHAGIDLAAPVGSKVYACKRGIVKTATEGNPIYGTYIIIDHGNGMTSTYAHLSKLNVNKGASVRQGQIIGLVGTTGMSTGPHLHFEIRKNGSPTDPEKLVG